MNRLLTALALAQLLFLAAARLPAQEIRVAYLEGKVEVLRGTAWRALSIGDGVPADARLRVGSQSCVEFSAEGTRITLTQPGEYSVRQLMTGARSLRAANAGRVLSTILRALPSVTRNQGSSTSGLRGDAMPVDDAGWLADNADLYYGEARDMLGAGRPDAAIEWLETGLPQVEPDREPEGRYLLAQALSMKGDTREALRQLDMVALTGREYWAGDFVLLKAKILIEASAFEPAVQWLSQRSLADDPALAAPYYLLLALAHRGAGDTEGEKQALENAVSAAGNGELGSEAARLLESP